MSRANGEVIIDGKAVAYFIWNGTVDCVWSGELFQSPAEAWTNYETTPLPLGPWHKCSCLARPAPAILYTNYGDGYHWPGSVCLTCRVIVDGRTTEDEDTTEGHPLQAVMRFEHGDQKPGFPETIIGHLYNHATGQIELKIQTIPKQSQTEKPKRLG
jgi:hypothetical protein